MPTRNEPWPNGTPCWVDLAVSDTAAAAKFYGDLFGWTSQDTGQEGGGYLLASKNGQMAAGIGPKPAPEMPSNWSTYFASSDVDATAEAIKAAGGTLLMDTIDVGSTGRMVFAAGPDGASFGVWQAGEHAGAGVYNEHGAYAWNELHSNDLAAARKFYADVFGFTYDDLTNPEFTYFVFKSPTDSEPIGGMGDNSMAPEGTPSHWLTWFQVDEVDGAVAKVGELGGTAMMAPSDSPFGRMAVVAGAQGEVFGLIDVNTRSGEAPVV